MIPDFIFKCISCCFSGFTDTVQCVLLEQVSSGGQMIATSTWTVGEVRDLSKVVSPQAWCSMRLQDSVIGQG